VVGDVKSLPADLQDKVYRPGADESYNVQMEFGKQQTFGPDEQEELSEE
jgi:hypothetical protein